MGVKGLWDAVAAAGLSVRMEALYGRKCAIDASFWIAHALVSQEHLRRGFDIYAIFFLKICYLLQTQIRPVFVFDGIPPDAKRRTLLKRKLLRERRGINHKLLAYKTLASHVGRSKLPKQKLAIKNEPLFDEDEILAIADELEPEFSPPEFLHNVDVSNIVKREEEEHEPSTCSTAAPSTFNVLCMPRSYKALKWLANAGIDPGNDDYGNITDRIMENYIPPDIKPEALSDFIRQELPNRPHGVQLPLDAEISPDTFEKLSDDVKYQIMNQIKDAWIYDDRLQSIKLKEGLDSFSKLQVEGYIRNCMLNKQLEQIKAKMAASIEHVVGQEGEDNVQLPSVRTEVFDYNTAVPKRSRRRKRFLNDLFVDMTPDYFALPEKKSEKRIESEVVADVDDSVFANDQEIFGDLVNSDIDQPEDVKAKDDDDFELFDSVSILTGKYDDDEMDAMPPVSSILKEDIELEEMTREAFEDTKKLDELNLPADDYLGDEDVDADESGDVTPSSPLGRLDSNFSTLEEDKDDTVEEIVHVIEPLRDIPVERVDDIEKGTETEQQPPKRRKKARHSQKQSHQEIRQKEPDEASVAIETTPVAPEEQQVKLPAPLKDDPRTKLGQLLKEAVSVQNIDADDLPYYYEFTGQLYKLERYSQRLENREKICELLRLFGIPYINAPSEAEAQCCHLNQTGAVYAVISDDSDVLPFGAKRIFKNFFSSHIFEVYMSNRIQSTLGLTQEQLALMAIICGCDYTAGVNGIGVVNALEVIKAYPTFQDLYDFRSWATGDVSLVTATRDECPIRAAYKKAHINYRVHWTFCPDFPNLEAYTLFLRPRVTTDTFGFKWRRPKVQEIRAFMIENSSLPREHLESCLSELSNRRAFQFLMEDVAPEITCRFKPAKSLESARKALEKNKASMRADLKRLEVAKRNKKALKIYRDKTPVAVIRSRRMKESLRVIRQRQLAKSIKNE